MELGNFYIHHILTRGCATIKKIFYTDKYISQSALTSSLHKSCWKPVQSWVNDHIYRMVKVQVQQYWTKPNYCIWPIRTHYTFVSTNEQFAPNEDDLAMVQKPSTITILYIWSLVFYVDLLSFAGYTVQCWGWQTVSGCEWLVSWNIVTILNVTDQVEILYNAKLNTNYALIEPCKVITLREGVQNNFF